MFSKIVDQKANKMKFNVDAYLTNQRRKEPAQIPSQQPVRRDHPQPPNPTVSPSITQIPPQQPKLPDPQIKSVAIQGKILQAPPLILKPNKKQKQVNLYYTQQGAKYKIQIKTIPQNGFQIKRDIQRGILQLSFKKAIKKKSFKQENNPQLKWMLHTQIKQQKISLTMNNKQFLKNIFKYFFDGLINQDQIKNIEEIKPINGIQSKPGEFIIPAIIEQDRGGDDQVVKFTLPTEQQLNQTEKFRKSIKDMKEDQKLYIITDIFKIKKEYQDLQRKRFKCPVFGCQKNQKHYRQVSQLKTHIKKSHPQLNKHGIEVTEFGTFEYSQKALDLALYLGKIFPGEMKKIIKKMKTRQIGQ